MKYNMKEIMTRAWEIKRENTENMFSLCLKMAWAEAKEAGSIKEEKSLKEKLVDKLNFIVSDAPDVYRYNVYVSDWEGYGKSRTYFAVYETRRNSNHNAKYDYGFYDNQTGKYVAGRHDLTDNCSLGGRHHLDCSIEF